MLLPIALLIIVPIQSQPVHSPLKFETASIKPSKAEDKGGLDILPGGGLRMGGVTLRMLIALAYDVRDNEIAGLPAWASTIGYTILAKPEAQQEDAHADSIVPGSPGWTRMQKRLRTLLAERFQLTVRKDSKEVQGYALVQAKGGTKLQPSTDSLTPGTNRSFGRIDGRNGSMTMLATVLGNVVGRPVVDHTGLTATYTYKLEYQQESKAPGIPEHESREPGPSVFTALQEQLGLKLEPARVPHVQIVVERVEHLSEN